MRDRATWTAFLIMCFVVTGLTGLFASYATSIPLERALRRSVLFDQVLQAAGLTDGAQRMEELRPALGSAADAVLSGPGELAARVAAARVQMLSEQEREARSVAWRVRIMVFVVTLLAAGLGAGILMLATKARG